MDRQADRAQLEALQRGPYRGTPEHVVTAVIRYCESAGLDPFSKPIKIVSVDDSRTGAQRALLVPITQDPS